MSNRTPIPDPPAAYMDSMGVLWVRNAGNGQYYAGGITTQRGFHTVGSCLRNGMTPRRIVDESLSVVIPEAEFSTFVKEIQDAEWTWSKSIHDALQRRLKKPKPIPPEPAHDRILMDQQGNLWTWDECQQYWHTPHGGKACYKWADMTGPFKEFESVWKDD